MLGEAAMRIWTGNNRTISHRDSGATAAMRRAIRPRPPAQDCVAPSQTISAQEDGDSTHQESLSGAPSKKQRVKQLMVELHPNSNIFFRAYPLQEFKQLVRLRFPACRETDHKEVFHWVVKSSPRIWHGRLLKSAWKDLGEGAWSPKASARPRAVHRKASGPAPQSQHSDAEPSNSAVMDASNDQQTSSVSYQLGTAEDRGSGNLLLTVHQTSQLCREAGNDSCASADGLGSSHGPASSEPAGGSQTPDGGDQVPGGLIQMTDGGDHGGSQAVESGTGCDHVRTGVESCQDDSYQNDNMAEGEDSGMAIAKGHSMVAASSDRHTALGIGVKQKKRMSSAMHKAKKAMASPSTKKQKKQGSEVEASHRLKQAACKMTAGDQSEPGSPHAAASAPASHLSHRSGCDSLDGTSHSEAMRPFGDLCRTTRSHNREVKSRAEAEQAAKALMCLSQSTTQL